MKKTGILFILFLLICTSPVFSKDIIQKLEELYPGISFQLDLVKQTEPSLTEPKNMNRLYDYVKSNDKEIKKGMELILNLEFYNRIIKANSVQFKIDGKADEWDTIPFYKTDPKGDGTKDGDMLLMKAFIDNDNVLYMMMKPSGTIKPELIFQPLLYFNQKKEWEVQVLISGTYQIVKEQINKQRYTRYFNFYKRDGARRDVE